MAILAIPGRNADLGEGTSVRRLLPTRGKRLVGPWCFLDHYGPHTLEGPGMALGQHPHTGLQTVSWLLEGEILHRDSLGSEQIIHPGQLNLMTSGCGIAHSEESPSPRGPRLHGVQLWVALPDSLRNSEPSFEHFPHLPEAGFGALQAKVLMGELGDAASPAWCRSPMMGAEFSARRDGREEVPIHPAFEHAVVLLSGRAAIGDLPLEVGVTYLLPLGTEQLALAMEQGARVLLLGGEPFPEPILMWWNFVCRTPDEMQAAREDWQEGRRFGAVEGTLPPIAAPALNSSTLKLRA